MKLRNPILILALALLPFLVVSCFWQGPAAAGSIAFSVSSKALSKSFGAAADTIRVYLMSGDTLYPIQPAGYDEVSFTAGSPTATYTSPPVPAGTYTLMIAVGEKDAGGFLITTDYAEPAEVTVSPGVNTPVTVTLKPSPFVNHGLWGQNVSGAALVNGTLYTTTETTLYQLSSLGDPIVLTEPTNGTVPAGYRINSVSEGWEFNDGNVPWLNTNQGIVPYSFMSSSLVTNFASGDGIVDVLDSAGVMPGSDIIAIYERSAGLGGSVVTNGVPGTWVDVDLSEILSGRPFLDVIPGDSPSFAYFASSLGAFRLPTDIIGVTHTAQQVLDAAVFFKVTDSGGKEIPILSLAIFDDRTAGPLLFMGTEKGVYSAVLDEATAAVIGTPTLVAGTEGKRISRMRTKDFNAMSGGTKTVAAFLSDTDVSFYDGAAVTSFPFYSGLPQDLPGEINTLSFVDNGKIHLVIVGKKGMVTYDTGWESIVG